MKNACKYLYFYFFETGLSFPYFI